WQSEGLQIGRMQTQAPIQASKPPALGSPRHGGAARGAPRSVAKRPLAPRRILGAPRRERRAGGSLSRTGGDPQFLAPAPVSPAPGQGEHLAGRRNADTYQNLADGA